VKIIKPSYEILAPPGMDEFPSGTEILEFIERAGRTCYKSEDRITPGSAEKFARMLVHERKHHSVIEHVSMSVRFVIDRGVSHELVRHRLCAFSQESTRYCNYAKDKFGEEITVIEPCFWGGVENSSRRRTWRDACQAAEDAYFWQLNSGATSQEARSVLPNSLKTEIVVTANLREWRHILTLRAGKAAHPQMREVMVPLLADLKTRIPVVFDNILEGLEKGSKDAKR